MKIFFFVLCIFISVDILKSQNLPKFSPLFSNKIEEQIKEKEKELDRVRQRAAKHFSYIGAYKRAAEIYDPPFYFGFDEPIDSSNEAYIKKFFPVSAVPYLIKRASKERIVIINEAHHLPQHRVFVRLLLEKMYKNGFEYLGLEALQFNVQNKDAPFSLLDTALNNRKYPLYSNLTGTYTREPQMANLIREALKIGFKLFAYDKVGRDREYKQAQNIQKIFNKDKKAKILILCGYHHLLENPSKDEKKWMATHLKDLTGINPLTIDQITLTNRSNIPNSPYYQFFHRDFHTVLVDSNENVFNGPKGFNKWDILVSHPTIEYINGRPNWLFWIKDNTKFKVSMNQLNITCPCLLKVFKKSDDPAAVPIDIIELKHNQEAILSLPQGQFRVYVLNQKGDHQEFMINVPAIRD